MGKVVLLAMLVVASLVGDARANDRAFRAARDRARSKHAPTKLQGVRDLIQIDSARSIRELERVIKESSEALERSERDLERALKAQVKMLPKLRRLIRRAEAGANIAKDADRVLARCKELERDVERLQRDTRVHLTIVKTAGEGFIRFRDPDAMRSIERGVANEFNTMVRLFYIAGMRDASRRERRAVLFEALQDSDARVRCGATRALIPFAREPGVQDAVEPLTADKYWPVRLGAYQVIAGAPFARAVERLCRAARDEKGEMALAIDAYLEELTGRNHRQDPSQWAVWWKANADAVRANTWTPPPPKERRAGETKTVASFFRIPLRSHRILFAIDFSDSMSIPMEIKDPQIAQVIRKYKLEQTRLGYAKAEFIRALGRLPNGVHFSVVGYNDDVKPFSNGRMIELTDGSRRNVIRWLSRLETADLTNIFSAINAVFKDYLSQGGARRLADLPDTVLLLTDGNATRGRFVEARDIMDTVEIWNAPLDVVFHCIGLGRGQDRVLLKGLSSSTGGYYVDVSRQRTALEPRKRRIPDDIPFDRRADLAPAEATPEPEVEEEEPELEVTPAAEWPPMVRKLAERFEDGEEHEMIAAAKRLGALGPVAAPAAPVLVEGLSDFREDVRHAVRDALGKMGGGAVPALVGALNSGDPDAMVGAADALTIMGPAGRAALPTLRKKADDDDPDVRAAVGRALKSVSR
ncbi:MAG: HEAT repeat domain-containing protein [Planctomycetota bacterium]